MYGRGEPLGERAGVSSLARPIPGLGGVGGGVDAEHGVAELASPTGAVEAGLGVGARDVGVEDEGLDEPPHVGVGLAGDEERVRGGHQVEVGDAAVVDGVLADAEQLGERGDERVV